MVVPLNRRAFLAASASASAAAIAALSSGRSDARDVLRAGPSGPFYGRVGTRGFAPGTADLPSKGKVILLDGRVLPASHAASRPIGAGKSVFVVPDGREGWSILYAEV